MVGSSQMTVPGADDKAGSYVLELIPGTRIALFRWSGPISLDDRRANMKILTDFCQEQEVRSLIVDGRFQVSETGTLDSFVFGKEVPTEMKGLRIAVVHRSDDDALPFIETVAKNRGSVTDAFLNLDEARAWLEEMEEANSIRRAAPRPE